MKKCIKLLSCIMVFAIVLATVVVPVNAAPVNAAAGKTVKYDGTTLTADAGEYSFATSTTTSNARLAVEGLWLRAGKSYYIGADIKMSSGKSIQYRFTCSGSNVVVNYPEGMNADTSIGITGGADWNTVGRIFSVTNGNSNQGTVKLEFRMMTGTNAINVSVKNIVVYEVTTTSVTTDAAQTGVSLNPVITYTFSNPLQADLAASAFNQDVVVNKVSDCVYTVALSNLDYSTTYNLTMSGVVDLFGQTVADKTINFTTEAKPATQPVAENLLTSSATVYNKGTNVTNTKESDGSYTVNVTDNGDTISLGRVNLEPGLYIGAVEVMNVNVPGSVKACAERYNIKGNGTSLTRTVSNKSLNTSSYTKLYTLITVTATDTAVEGDRYSQIELGFKLSNASSMTEACQVKAKNFRITKLQSLDLDNDEYSAVAVKEDNEAALYITGPAASVIYFLSADYSNGAMSDISYGKATLASGVASKIEITAGEGYKLFIWDSNLKPLNTVFEFSQLK